MSNDKQWMIYGANGYTGRLTAQLAAERGLKPVLAGRSESRVRAVAEALDLPWRQVDLNDPRQLDHALAEVDAVVHMAGPFSRTSRPMFDACLRGATHYLDITGEIEVLEDVLGRHRQAQTAGITAIPGVGFDVVPTDCLAAMLAEQLPDATELDLAFGGVGKMSPGTTKTMIEGMGKAKGGAARIDGRIVPVPAAWKSRSVPFPRAKPHVVSIPWGDVSSAYHSTGIPTITTYMSMPLAAVKSLKRGARLQPLLKLAPLRSLAQTLAGWLVKGPDEALRISGYTDVWGEVRNANGDWVQGALTTPEGYSFTADSAIRAVLAVLDEQVRPGAYTPSQAFGKDFVFDCARVKSHPFRYSSGDGKKA